MKLFIRKGNSITYFKKMYIFTCELEHTPVDVFCACVLNKVLYFPLDKYASSFYVRFKQTLRALSYNIR